MSRTGKPNGRVTPSLAVTAHIAAGFSLFVFWFNFVLAGLIAVIGLVLAGMAAKKKTDRTGVSNRGVAAVCVIVLVAVAIRWYLSTPVEYVIDNTPRPGDPIP